MPERKSNAHQISADPVNDDQSNVADSLDSTDRVDASSLTDAERSRYQWQMWSPEIGETGQLRLKRARVLISRCGGVGGAVAYQLAAAGVGTLVIAHAGNIRTDDLNRQLLMTHAAIGQPRAQCAAARLRELNPHVNVVPIAENMHAGNVQSLLEQVDIVVDCAPLFAERFAMNDEAVRQRKPMVDCAMYDFEAQLTTILPGQTACLRCLVPNEPASWKREFPVFGAVAGTIGSLAAVEVIKLITGVGDLLSGRLLLADLRAMSFRTLTVDRNPQCAVCATV